MIELDRELHELREKLARKSKVASTLGSLHPPVLPADSRLPRSKD